MRIIDADEFISKLEELYQYAGWDKRDVHFSLADTICNLDMIPTVEAIPIEWILSYIQEYPYMTASSMLHYWSLDQAIERKEKEE